MVFRWFGGGGVLSVLRCLCLPVVSGWIRRIFLCSSRLFSASLLRLYFCLATQHCCCCMRWLLCSSAMAGGWASCAQPVVLCYAVGFRCICSYGRHKQGQGPSAAALCSVRGTASLVILPMGPRCMGHTEWCSTASSMSYPHQHRQVPAAVLDMCHGSKRRELRLMPCMCGGLRSVSFFVFLGVNCRHQLPAGLAQPHTAAGYCRQVSPA